MRKFYKPTMQIRDHLTSDCLPNPSQRLGVRHLIQSDPAEIAVGAIGANFPLQTVSQLQLRTCFSNNSRIAISDGVCERPRVRLFSCRCPCASYTRSISSSSSRSLSASTIQGSQSDFTILGYETFKVCCGCLRRVMCQDKTSLKQDQ
jgi:hypothetical protein